MNALEKLIEHCKTLLDIDNAETDAACAELERLQRVEHLAGVLLYELDNDGDVQYIADAIRAALKGETK